MAVSAVIVTVVEVVSKLAKVGTSAFICVVIVVYYAVSTPSTLVKGAMLVSSTVSV
jgi:hypothetical protein